MTAIAKNHQDSNRTKKSEIKKNRIFKQHATNSYRDKPDKRFKNYTTRRKSRHFWYSEKIANFVA